MSTPSWLSRSSDMKKGAKPIIGPLNRNEQRDRLRREYEEDISEGLKALASDEGDIDWADYKREREEYENRRTKRSQDNAVGD